jgi:hypothetical protein
MLVVCGIGLNYYAAPAQAQADIDVNLSFFYDRLAPHGEWIEHPQHNWIWRPNGMPVDWRPYTDGRWVYTDDFGWMWDSDLDWGWACFHYGRWDWDDQFGWFWVPGYEWGPAWVAWRTGPGFIGWAPLPPVVGWRAGIGLALNGFDLDDIPVRRWCFVDERFFDEPILRLHVLLPARNVTIFGETRNITRFDIAGARIVNVGVPIGRIQEVTGRPVPRFQVRHVDSVAALRLPHERGGIVNVFSPRVLPAPAGVVPPRREEFERRQQAERAQLEERQRAEQANLEQRHQAERAAPGGAVDQVQRRQEAERQALQSEHQHQQRLLNNRQRAESQRMGPGRPAGAPGESSRPSRR